MAGMFRHRTLTRLRNCRIWREPSRCHSHILILLDKIRSRAPAGKKRIGRRLYLFLAGHGVSPAKELDEAGLLTVEARGALVPYLPGKQSADQFCLSARFEEVCTVHGLLPPHRSPARKNLDSDHG